MRLIDHEGNLPPPVRRLGLWSKRMQEAVKSYGLAGGIEIWECGSVSEVGSKGHLDECEFQVLIDKKSTRYYLVAMSVDVDRVRAKVDTTESGDQIVVPDYSPKPATVAYYCEVSSGEYKLWRTADAVRRRAMIVQRIERQRKLDAMRERGVVIP